MCLLAYQNESLVSFLADWPSMDEFDEVCNESLDTLKPEGRECTCGSGPASRGFFEIVYSECPWHKTTISLSRIGQLWNCLMIVRDPMLMPDFLRPYWRQCAQRNCNDSMTVKSSLIHTTGLGIGYGECGFRAEWATLAGIVMSNTPNIHCVEPSNPVTPLMTLIEASMYRMPGGDWGYVHRCLMLWLSVVQSNGHDLEEYGRRENELLADKELNLKRHIYFERINKKYSPRSKHVVCLRGYKYGAEPKDWEILWSVPEKGWAAAFWRLVEDGRQLVPGAWVEDSDDEEGDEYIFSGCGASLLGPQSWL